MQYFLNGGRDERSVLRHRTALELYKELDITRLLVIPYAIVEDGWQRLWHDNGDLFDVPGLQIKSLTTYDTDLELIRERIEWAEFVYLPGGSQKTLLRRLSELGTDEQVRAAVAKDRLKLLGGGSAGAMVMGSHCIIGHKEVTAVVDGLNFIPDTVIDSHFSNRNREPRLRSVLKDYPELTGIGIDENTGLIIEDRSYRVFGAGTASIYKSNSKETYDSYS